MTVVRPGPSGDSSARLAVVVIVVVVVIMNSSSNNNSVCVCAYYVIPHFHMVKFVNLGVGAHWP